MGIQEYRANYLAAMHEANSQLTDIFRELEQLQLRRELIQDVLGALDPFLTPTSAAPREPLRKEPAMSAPVRYQAEAQVSVAPVSEPVIPASFAPLSEVITDPIQSRINRALGLAVA
jgi:hypothetical protein